MLVSHQLITAVEQKSFQTLFKSYRILGITMTYLAAIFFFIFRKVQVGQIEIIIKKNNEKKNNCGEFLYLSWMCGTRLSLPVRTVPGLVRASCGYYRIALQNNFSNSYSRYH